MNFAISEYFNKQITYFIRDVIIPLALLLDNTRVVQCPAVQSKERARAPTTFIFNSV